MNCTNLTFWKLKMKFFGTGLNGFLLSNIGIEAASQFDADVLLAFGCPASEEPCRLAESILTTSDMIRLAIITKKKLAFASSQGAKYLTTPYEIQKRALEDCIQTLVPSACILRIPRVYDRSRSTGLIQKLKESKVPEKDMLNKTEFITLEQFKEWFFNSITKEGIVEYTGPMYKMTLKDIKQFFKL